MAKESTTVKKVKSSSKKEEKAPHKRLISADGWKRSLKKRRKPE